MIAENEMCNGLDYEMTFVTCCTSVYGFDCGGNSNQNRMEEIEDLTDA
jgi:hypothetical protein